ncbi:MAG: transposase [Elusimicrobiota bacterium]
MKKTRTKTVHTLHLGCCTAHETLLQCGHCPNQAIYAAEELSRLAPSGCTFGYDGGIFVGKALFCQQRRTQEIVEELRSRNIRISVREVGYLGKKFVVYLALAHRQSAPRLKEVLRDQGGYILHLDGTCERGGPMLMSSLDSISEIVLGNVKVPSEKTEEIIPFLEEIKSRYGVPLASVHDMGAGILAAVKKVFPGTLDFICHFHFLRDVGKDLLEEDYDAIRKHLRKHALTEKLLYQARQLKTTIDQQPGLADRFCQSVQADSLPAEGLERFPILCAYSLIQWVLEGKTHGDGYGFPFDRPQVEFAKRLRIASQELESIKDIHLRGQWRDNIPLFKLSCELKKVSADEPLEKLIAAIDVKIQVFDQLRHARRIAEAGGSAGLNSGGDSLPMGPIQKAVRAFRKRITSRSDYQSPCHWKTLIDQLDKYGEKLFADPIAVQTPNGRRLVQPQRTNNIMERFFRDFRRGARRKSGHNSINKFLQTMIADTPLVRNLENPPYLKVLLNGQPTLGECFAQIDAEAVRKEMEAAQMWPDRVPQNIRQLIAAPAFPDALCGLFQKSLDPKSN